MGHGWAVRLERVDCRAVRVIGLVGGFGGKENARAPEVEGGHCFGLYKKASKLRWVSRN
jgi:hypothetical protein